MSIKQFKLVGSKLVEKQEKELEADPAPAIKPAKEKVKTVPAETVTEIQEAAENDSNRT